MESWRLVFRNGIAPLLSTAGLRYLRQALQINDSRLLQGLACLPSPLVKNRERSIQACDALHLALWMGRPGMTVGELHEAGENLLRDVDALLGEEAAGQWFIRWFDETPRELVRRELLREVETVLRDRLGEFSRGVSRGVGPHLLAA